MDEKARILSAMHDAVDRMDEAAMEQALSALENAHPLPFDVGDTAKFAGQVRKKYAEEQDMMKPKHAFRMVTIVAAVLLVGMTVAYASGIMNKYTFEKEGRFVTVEGEMTEQQALAMLDESAESKDDAEPMQAPYEEMAFDSLAQAEAELGFPIVLPEKMPEMAFDSGSGMVISFGEGAAEQRTAWITFADDAGRMLGLTIDREDIAEGETVTTMSEADMDPGSMGAYKSAQGIDFTLLTESDDAGERTAHIATTDCGKYTYTVILFGFEEAERQEILDSVSLAQYSK